MSSVPIHTSTNIYKSRKTLLTQFQERGIDTSNMINNITENELKIMNKNSDIDFEVKQNDYKISIKYILNSKLRNTTLRNQITSFMEEEKILDEEGNINKDIHINNHELIFIIKESPNESLIKVIDEIYNEYKLYVNLFWINTLLFNILDHEYVPNHKKITNDDFKELKIMYNLNSKHQLPFISRHDPVSKVLGIRPGEVVKITRPSQSCGKYITYRCCK